MNQQAMKLTFRHLYETHQLHLARLAHCAGISPRIPYFMLQGQPVPHNDAIRVFDAISQVTGVSYSFDTVNVKLLPQIQKTGDKQCIRYGD